MMRTHATLEDYQYLIYAGKTGVGEKDLISGIKNFGNTRDLSFPELSRVRLSGSPYEFCLVRIQPLQPALKDFLLGAGLRNHHLLLLSQKRNQFGFLIPELKELGIDVVSVENLGEYYALVYLESGGEKVDFKALLRTDDRFADLQNFSFRSLGGYRLKTGGVLRLWQIIPPQD